MNQIVKVNWTDAEEIGEIGWNSLEDMVQDAKRDCPVMTTVGFLIYSGTEHIAVANSMGDGLCSTVDKIPKRFINSMEYLEGDPNAAI
jgi:hypothetical protein